MTKELLHNLFKSYLRHFPIAKGKFRIFTLFWKAFSFGQYRRLAVLKQAEIKLNCDLTKFLQRYFYYFGSYEAEYCELWMKMARQASTIFDVGANIGLYSLLASATNPKAEIHAFEPTPEIVTAFRSNIELNELDNISVNPVAVGKEKGTAVLRRIQGGEDIYDGMNFVTTSQPLVADETISLIALDDYCLLHEISRIDLLKIDIEGGEFDALLGAQNLLCQQAISCIFIELVEDLAQRSGHSTVDIKKLLLNAGYRIFQLQSGALKPVPPEKIHTGQGDNVIALPLTSNVVAL